MEEIYRHFGETNLWGQYVFAKKTKVTVTEIWRNPMTGDQSTIHREVQLNFLSQQLFGYKFGVQGHPYDCVVRVVYVNYNPSESKENLSATDLDQILDTFQLRLAFNFVTSSIAGISGLLSASPKTQIYTLSYHPALALIWSHDNAGTSSPLTNAVCFATSEYREYLKRLLERHWQLATHAMLLPFLCTLLLSSEVDAWQQKVKQRVREIEVRTGHHQFRNRTEMPATQELGEVLAQLSGYTSRLAELERKLRMIDALNEFVLENVQPKEHRGAESASSQTQKDTILLRHNVSIIQSRAKMQEVDNSFTLVRVNTQTSALYGTISQSDSLHSIEVARDSRLIAMSSQHDSSSMKMLAVVTIMFLPGSFVAAVFSMPIFNWAGENADSVVNPHFSIYWAVTIPLTLLTFVFYGVWLLVHKWRWNQKKNNTIRELIENPLVAESKKLTSRRKEILSEKD